MFVRMECGPSMSKLLFSDDVLLLAKANIDHAQVVKGLT